MDSFLDNIRAQFDDVDASSICLDSEFRNVDGWSSMVGLGIIMMISECYDYEMSANELRSLRTIREIYEFLKSKDVSL